MSADVAASPDLILDPSPGLDRDELMQHAVAAKVLSEVVKAADATVRAAVLADLLEDWRTTGDKTFNASAFGLDGIASITLSEPQDAVVVEDSEAFLDFVMDHHPAQVVSEPEVEPAWQKAYFKSLLLDQSPDGPVDPATGEPVPGLGIKRGGEPTKFNVTLDKTRAREVTDAVMRRSVAALTDLYLPAVGELES